MACPRQIFCRAAKLHQNRCFMDHLAGALAHDMTAQDPIGRLVGQNLDKALDCASMRLARPFAVKGNFADLYSIPSAFRSSSVLPTEATSGLV